MRRQRRRPRSPFGATVTGELESLSLPPGLTAETIEVGGETLVVFAFPGKRDAPSPLTEAEQHIVDLVLQGCTTAQIAATRGVARTTVSSQLQSIYRKLGITSRIELVCKLG